MEKKFEDVSKKVVYTTVGAVVTAAEKAQAVVEELAEKGQEVCQKKAVKNEELKRNAKEAFKKAVNVTVVVDEKEGNVENLMASLEKMSPEEIAKIKQKISELETTPQVNEEPKDPKEGK